MSHNYYHNKTYKRIQVERAIAKVTGRIVKKSDPHPTLKMTIKRLVDFDRKLGISSPLFPAHYAFFDGASDFTKRGNDKGYTLLHAFSLLLGVTLLRGGFSQSDTIRILREYRDGLKEELHRILSVKPQHRRKECNEKELERLLENGNLLTSIRAMSYIILEPTPGSRPIYERDKVTGELELGNIARSPKKLLRRMEFFAKMGVLTVVYELANPAYQLQYLLESVPVSWRGQSSDKKS